MNAAVYHSRSHTTPGGSMPCDASTALQAQESQQNCPSFCKLADPLVLFLEIQLLILIYSELVSRI